MSGRVFHKLARAGDLSLTDWRYLATAVQELFLARIRHGAQPIGRILRELQEAGVPYQGGAKGDVDLARLSWAVNAAAARVPWRSDCLVRVMAADRWLRRCQFRPDFYLGAGKNQVGEFEAHAWLHCNGIMVTGGHGEGFATLISPSRILSRETSPRGAVMDI